MARKEDIRYLEDTSVDALLNALQKFELAGKKTVFIFACASNNYQHSELSPALQSLSIGVFGAVFPSVVHGSKLYETGTVIVAFDEAMPLTIYNNISRNAEFSIDGQLPAFEKNASLVVLVDAMYGGMEDFLEKLYQNLGSGLNIIGGAAGSLDLIQKPCLLSNQGLIEDAAIIATLPRKLSALTGHGWEILEGPFVVTESSGHEIISINYQPAFEIYQEAVESLSGKKMDQENFFEIARNFPFGISELNGDLLVRDPASTEAGTISCFGNVPQNSTVYILRGDADKLINAALETSRTALEGIDHSDKTVLLFDCISRQLYLGERTRDEINGIDSHLKNATTAVGAFSLGEIANRDGGPMQLMNKSFAIGSF